MCIIEACGLKAGLMHHLRIGSDCGLGGRVFSVQRVMGVTDYLHSQSISHTFDIYVQKEGIRSLAAVPVVVQRKVHAVLYAGARAAVRLPNRILESLTRTARNLEQDIAVLEATAVSPVEISSTVQESEGLHAEHERSGPMWEQVRKAYTRLRVLAAHVSDDEIQRELEEIANLLVAYPRIMPVHLSTREIDVLSCVAMGLTNIEAAAQMGVGPETVKSYLRNCMRKLDVHNRYEAVSSARSLGVIP
ncbi:MAG: helix-turn-helix transcriptional regulator [Lawsonella clevelandensis]|jgi:luxR family bacterial regulatory protein|uniref:Helix-turn-helix transcriptional regulator n=2 Tax=Lawsonella clevelandensis TaxID=1528099 RepID=A0A2W5I872_9ACTN|nr:MAG: helix-turn-helix transcriptional regulator [Lawsonella clevelandensis]